MNGLMRPQYGMLEDFRKEMDQMMGRFFNGDSGHHPGGWSPRVDVAEAEDAFDVSVDRPGLKPEHVNVEVKNGDLLISGERHEEHKEQGKTWHRVERHSGSFRRMIRLGEDVSAEKVSAEYKDGVLKVHVPKSDSAKSRKIEVKG